MARPEWIEVGRVSRPHGVRGEVRIIPASDNPERFVRGSVVHARPLCNGLADSRPRERARLTIEEVRGENGYPIVAFREICDRNGAERLRGQVLEVRAAELPALTDGEYYPFDLEGLSVKDRNGVVVGRVREVIDSPAHALLAIALESGEEVLVPFVQAAVPVVELAEGHVVVERRFLASAVTAPGGGQRRGERGHRRVGDAGRS
jgi:16S rRNA processing protein RimM